MNTQVRRGKRLAVKFATVQMACAVVASIAFLSLGGGNDANEARSAIVGGAIASSGTLVFAWRMFANDWPSMEAARGFYLGEIFKWIWMIGAWCLALMVGGFDAFALLIGLISAQLGFWLAIRFFR